MSAKRASLAAVGAAVAIAGCAGGGGGARSTPPTLAQVQALTNSARAYLEFPIPARGTVSKGRAKATTGRKITYVSPATANVGIAVSNGSTTIYSTSFAIAPPACVPLSGNQGYGCTINLPVGTYTLYANLYDQSMNLLSTNLYANQAPVTIYANGSATANNLTIPLQGVVYSTINEGPHSCFFPRGQHVPVHFLDASNYEIVGPLANPITAYVVAANGGGLAAFDLYAYVNGVSQSIDNVTISDTSIYTTPFFNIGTVEGSVLFYAGVANGFQTYFGGYKTASAYGRFTVSDYHLWGLDAYSNLYTIGLEAAYNTTYDCSVVLADQTLNAPTIVNGMQDGSGHGSEVLVGDTQAVYVIAVGGTSGNHVNIDYSHVPAIVRARTVAKVALSPTQTLVNLLESTSVRGRFTVISQDSATGLGHIDLYDTYNGVVSPYQSFNLQIPAGTTSCCETWTSGPSSSQVLYYTQPNNPILYALDRANNGAFLTPVSFAATPLANGALYAIQSSGLGYDYMFVRGSDGNGSYYVCEFDASLSPLNILCHRTGSHVTSAASIRYDPGSGKLGWASGGTDFYAFDAHQTPASFMAGFSTAPAAYTLSHQAFRFTGTVGTAGILGLYGGSPSQVTFLRYNSSTGTWNWLATQAWPNPHLSTTQY
ncbi:MAG: hypothetical protein JO359_05440 [Candidatus Eremiobacteraeota bacterium]|nr:hypothetical protein [Candidatus Eremiobacteraeota bacterium]